LASCRLTETYGPGVAEFLGTLVECVFPGGSAAAGAMDDLNNSEGRDLGADTTDTRSCDDKCMGALYGGDLNVLTGGSEGDQHVVPSGVPVTQ
jgi:hypothetical protein